MCHLTSAQSPNTNWWKLEYLSRFISSNSAFWNIWNSYQLYLIVPAAVVATIAAKIVYVAAIGLIFLEKPNFTLKQHHSFEWGGGGVVKVENSINCSLKTPTLCNQHPPTVLFCATNTISGHTHWSLSCLLGITFFLSFEPSTSSFLFSEQHPPSLFVEFLMSCIWIFRNLFVSLIFIVIYLYVLLKTYGLLLLIMNMPWILIIYLMPEH